MTGDRVKQWALAELTANPAVTTLLPSPDSVLSADESGPADEGVFVGDVGDTRREQYGDAVELRVRVVARGGEGACRGLCDAVSRALLAVPGRPRAWLVAPREKGLRLHAIDRVTLNPPAQEGPESAYWAATLVYQVRGSDAAA